MLGASRCNMLSHSLCNYQVWRRRPLLKSKKCTSLLSGSLPKKDLPPLNFPDDSLALLGEDSSHHVRNPDSVPGTRAVPVHHAKSSANGTVRPTRRVLFYLTDASASAGPARPVGGIRRLKKTREKEGETCEQHRQVRKRSGVPWRSCSTCVFVFQRLKLSAESSWLNIG